MSGDQVLFYIFALSFLLIVVVYFVGVSTDAKSLSDALNGLLKTSTGRNQQGQFAQYPATPAAVAGS